jgi:hypothetical protein
MKDTMKKIRQTILPKFCMTHTSVLLGAKIMQKVEGLLPTLCVRGRGVGG